MAREQEGDLDHRYPGRYPQEHGRIEPVAVPRGSITSPPGSGGVSVAWNQG